MSGNLCAKTGGGKFFIQYFQLQTFAYLFFNFFDYSLSLVGSVRFGSVRFGSVRFGSVRFGFLLTLHVLSFSDVISGLVL